jgi:hypothetical protein
MKKIQSITSWINGKNIEFSVFNLYATSVLLNQSASFVYYLYPINENGAAIPTDSITGILNMDSEIYSLWQTDNFAWDWAAKELKINIIGDYINSALENKS